RGPHAAGRPDPDPGPAGPDRPAGLLAVQELAAAPQAPVFGRIGRLVGRRPALVAVASGAIVLALAAGTLGFRQNYDFVSQLPSHTQARRPFADLQSGFPAGALNPTQVYVRGDQPLDEAALAQLGARLQQGEGGGQVQAPQLHPDRRGGGGG